ncbi:cytochrome c oxidase assembly protein [Croceibacterium sp. TMG7-5b_MA50]|uniref:cytochrome c oxidase assembly protein n=1 Tax=Croceibacterium sp. TMG7-5b_MA50 TaxID=3121290 RepID=UPI003221C196
MTGAGQWIPYCGAAPLPAEWLARWNFDPVLLLALAALSFGWWRWRDAACSGRAAATALGIVLILFVSPFCALGSALFAARVVHHVVLATALAAALGSATGLHTCRLPGSLPVLTAIQVLCFWAWHAPPLYAAALSHDAIFWAMQVSITGTAALWWARVRQGSAAAAVTSLLATMMLMGVLGALITFAGRALYAPHWLSTQGWGLSPLGDQQLAGILMWAPASAIYLLAAMAILYRALRRDATERAAA